MATKNHIYHHKSENPSIEDSNINLKSPIKPLAKHLTRYNNSNVAQGGRSLPRQLTHNQQHPQDENNHFHQQVSQARSYYDQKGGIGIQQS